MMITYFDFDIIFTRSGHDYSVQAHCPLSGDASKEFVLPFSEDELEDLIRRIGHNRSIVRGAHPPRMQAAQEFGARLFDALFTGSVRDCLTRALHDIERPEHQGKGVRLRLHMTGTPELADIPWEYLYHPNLCRFLALCKTTPLVRYLDLSIPARPPAVSGPLRVLAMATCPSDYMPLDINREQTKLNEALIDLLQSKRVSVDWVESGTLGALRRQLRRANSYHVFHFIGHGIFEPPTQGGALLLEDERGRGYPISGQDLGTLLHNHGALRLAVLNACEGARTFWENPFAGVAQSLLQQGIPAVIAMQFAITDQAASTLTHEFYSALADGYPVDAALVEARQAIFTQDNSMEWGTPVLFMRASDGQLFKPDGEPWAQSMDGGKAPSAFEDLLERPIEIDAKQIREEVDAMSGNQNGMPEGTLALCGYFFVEKEGLEEILIRGNVGFPIVKLFKPGENSIDEAVSEAVMEAIEEMGINGFQFRAADYSEPIYRRLYQIDKRRKIASLLPYILVKVGLRKKVEGGGPGWQGCKWEAKAEIAKLWRDEDIHCAQLPLVTTTSNVPDIFKAINDEWYYENLGSRVLQCVDMLVFRKDGGEIRFLMIRRHSNEKWEYPKGGLYYHETFLEGALREIEEEIGIVPDQLVYCANLDWQTPDMSYRREYYDMLRVQGLTFHYIGKLEPSRLDAKHDKFEWMSFKDARESVHWLKIYGPEFFDRWKQRENEILRKAGIVEG